MERPVTALLSAPGAEVCASLYTHRILSTSQVAELHGSGRSRRRALQVLTVLEHAGYVARVRVHGRREAAWHLTTRGVDATEGRGVEERGYYYERGRRLGIEELATKASGPGQTHTLATNETALCFVREARRRGDDCGPFSWRNETVFPLGPRRGRRLIVDAVLDYTVSTPTEDIWLCRFLELDRGTERVTTLAEKLEAYAELYRYSPAWASYPCFPRLVIVLAGRPEAELERRLRALCEVAGRMPALIGCPEVGAVATTLTALRRDGPFAPVFIPLADPEIAVGLLGHDRVAA